MIFTTTEIKHIDNSLEVLEEFAVEMDLDLILAQEFDSGLPSDINNAW